MTQRLVLNGDVNRVIVVVLDGLRPDAITTYALPNVLRLARNGAATFDATTVAPSVTAVAMASLLTGADPSRHGLRDDRFRLPRPSGPLHPMPRHLANHALPTSGFMARVPWMMRPVASRIAGALGFDTVRFRGAGAAGVLAAAKRQILAQRSGLIFLHWPDADAAGHAHGWMSPQYADAARALDAALGQLMRIVDAAGEGTMLVALADHGGGGAQLRHHNSDHPLDRTIPVIFGGAAVRPATLGAGVRLVDIPPTVLSVLGVPTPESYCGVSLTRLRTRRPSDAMAVPASGSQAAA
jgi:predicted AlkP superfamily pyrophosphatase or phosphodiesterase